MDNGTRRCPRCENERPVEEFGKSGSYCRECSQAYQRDYRRVKRRPVVCEHCSHDFVPNHSRMRFCSAECRRAHGSVRFDPIGCVNCEKQFTPARRDSRFCSVPCRDAHRHKAGMLDRVYRERRRRSTRVYYEANREKRLAAGAAWREANGERLQASRQRWRENNRYTVRVSSRRRHPERHAAKQRVRVARVRALTPYDIDSCDVLAKVAYWGSKCWICAGPFEAVDHVKPLAKGGLNIISNLRPICRSCNSRKRDRWLGPSRLGEIIP